MFEIEDDDATTPAQWVDTLIADARESASAVVRETDQQAADVAELGGLVTHMAKTIGRMAETVQRTHAAATNTKHAITAADWFWRKVKAMATVPRRLAAGGACLACGLSGHVTGTPTAHPTAVSLPIGKDVNHERLLAVTCLLRNDGESHWQMSQLKAVQGDRLTAAMEMELAADAGHPMAVAIMGSRDTE
jgi:hypothetical protein